MIHTQACDNLTIQCADGEEQQAPKIDAVAYTGALMRRVARYDAPVIVDLNGLVGLGETHPVYRNHDDGKILGVGVTTRQGNQLVTAGELTNVNPDVDEITRLGKKGFPFQASIGVDPVKVDKLRAGQSAEVNGIQVSGPAYVVRAGKLFEISVVNRGADDHTSTRIAATFNKELGNMTFEQFVEDNGFSVDALNEKQVGVLRAAYDKQSGDSGKTVESVIEAAKQRDERSKSYARVIEAAMHNGMDTATAERLIEAANRDQLSTTEFELQVLRLQRAPSFNSQRHSGGDISGEVVEAAIARSIGGDVADAYRPEVLEASEKRFKHGLSLVELMQLSARRNGHRDISHRDVGALLKAAFAPVEAAGASTYSLAGVLSNVANKMIRMGFESVEQEWRKIASVSPVNDLKATTSYSLTGDFVYQEVGPSGELKAATMGEESYLNQAKTYGRLFSLTRADFINDDLGAFNRVRRLLGRGAALAYNTIFWSAFLKDLSTFYTVGRGNKIESDATTPLGLDSLTAAWTKFGEKTDPDGQPLGMEPSILVVPNALKIVAEQLAQDPEIRVNGGTAAKTYTTRNPMAGRLDVCSSVYLSNATIANSSAQNWFLLADPMDLPMMEVLFLYGREFPFIESADADFDVLGVQMRGYHDFGVAKTEHRAALMVEDTN